MSHIFEGCILLKSINLPNINSSSVNDMSYIFSECISLESINLF